MDRVAGAPCCAQPARIVVRPGRPGVAGSACAPRHRHRQPGVDGGDVERRRRLHVEHRRVLRRVRDLQDCDRTAGAVVEGERPVALAAEVTGAGGRHAEQRPGHLERVGGGQGWAGGGQHEIHGRHATSVPPVPRVGDDVL